MYLNRIEVEGLGIGLIGWRQVSKAVDGDLGGLLVDAVLGRRMGLAKGLIFLGKSVVKGQGMDITESSGSCSVRGGEVISDGSLDTILDGLAANSLPIPLPLNPKG